MTDVFDAYANYYDLLYRDKDYPGEAEYIDSLIHTYNLAAKQILELGCGTGLHAIQLAKRGYQVHGVDLSPAMISKARNQVPSALAGQVSHEEGDVRHIRLGRIFDVVISLFHVASYQTSQNDIRAMIQTATEHLASGGVFIFDFWYGPAVLNQRPEVRVKRLQNDACNLIRIAEPTIYPNENMVEVNYTILATDLHSLTTKQINECHRMRYFFIPELLELLESAGLSAESAFDWESKRPLGLDTWNSAIVATKR